MTRVKKLCGKTLTVVFLVAFAGVVNAATVWTGPAVQFTKDAFADPMLAANQDSLTPLVSITRASTQGLFNPVQEPFFQSSGASPVDTEWAFQDLNGNPDSGVNAENFASLVFSDWQNSLERKPANNILERPGVVHLLSDDIYLDILFTEWGVGGGAGGGFSYVRTSPIPVPAAAWLLGSALGLLGFVRRRRAT